MSSVICRSFSTAAASPIPGKMNLRRRAKSHHRQADRHTNTDKQVDTQTQTQTQTHASAQNGGGRGAAHVVALRGELRGAVRHRDGVEGRAGREDSLAVCPLVGVLSGALGLGCRVGEGEDEGVFVVLGHLLNNLSERSDCKVAFQTLPQFPPRASNLAPTDASADVDQQPTQVAHDGPVSSNSGRGRGQTSLVKIPGLADSPRSSDGL